MFGVFQNEAATLEACLQRVEDSAEPDATLFRDITRVLVKRRPRAAHKNFDQMHELIKHRAWLDAAMLLVGDHAPGWNLRRLDLGEGFWTCMLSRFPAAPIEFDETVEAQHESLPLAVLASLFLALLQPPATAASQGNRPSPSSEGYPVICDNFA